MQVTSGSKWRERREKGVLLQFPTTQNIARIRPLDIAFFIKEGRVHNLLESAAFESLTEKEVTEFTEDELKAFEATVDFLRNVAKQCFVSPRIVENPEADDEISVKDLTLDELYFLFGVLVRPAQPLDSFRPKPEINVGSVHASEEYPQTGKRDHADSRDGEQSDGDAGRLVGDTVRHGSHEIRVVG